MHFLMLGSTVLSLRIYEYVYTHVYKHFEFFFKFELNGNNAIFYYSVHAFISPS